MNKTDTFNEHRGLLFGIAYRMLGSVHDAEDAVQETFIRWDGTDIDHVRDSRNFLVSITTRLSIDVLKSARKTREVYVGDWLPEPLADSKTSESAELAESLSTAFMLMLERLSATERAAFLLRSVFEYSYAEIATMVGKSEANCRQIVRRAKERVRQPERTFEQRDSSHDELVAAFTQAVMGGSVGDLIALLAEDASLVPDHGGKAASARRAIHGASKVARFLVGVNQKFPPIEPDLRLTTINGGVGLVVFDGGIPVTAMALAIAEGKIGTIYVTRNPDKLGHLSRIEV